MSTNTEFATPDPPGLEKFFPSSGAAASAFNVHRFAFTALGSVFLTSLSSAAVDCAQERKWAVPIRVRRSSWAPMCIWVYQKVHSSTGSTDMAL